MSLSCVRGCTRLRKHLADCEDHEECKGCLPRMAEYGLLCWPCHRRLELMLHDAPTVYDWLTGNLGTGQGAAPLGDFLTGKTLDGSPAPIKVNIFDVRQQLNDQLRLWVEDLCQRHDLKGPDHRYGDDPRNAAFNLTADAKYLKTWLDRIEAFEWVGEWWEELAQTMSDAHALAPWRPEAKRVNGVECPECGECALMIFGGESDVTCTRCRAMITEQMMGLWELILSEGKVEV